MSFFAKKFDKYCGIVKTIDPNTEKEIYIVYAWLFDGIPEKKIDGSNVGESIGSGETQEDAFIDAIKNLVSIRREYDSSIEKLQENIEKILYSPSGHKEKMVVPITNPSYGIESYEEDKKITGNADVFVNYKEKIVQLGIR